MHLKSLVAAAGFAGAMVVGAASIGTPVQAQNAREAELIGFHSCARKAIAAPASDSACSSARTASERHAEWRKHHADWWWWEGR